MNKKQIELEVKYSEMFLTYQEMLENGWTQCAKDALDKLEKYQIKLEEMKKDTKERR